MTLERDIVATPAKGISRASGARRLPPGRPTASCVFIVVSVVTAAVLSSGCRGSFRAEHVGEGRQTAREVIWLPSVIAPDSWAEWLPRGSMSAESRERLGLDLACSTGTNELVTTRARHDLAALLRDRVAGDILGVATGNTMELRSSLASVNPDRTVFPFPIRRVYALDELCGFLIQTADGTLWTLRSGEFPVEVGCADLLQAVTTSTSDCGGCVLISVFGDAVGELRSDLSQLHESHCDFPGACRGTIVSGPDGSLFWITREREAVVASVYDPAHSRRLVASQDLVAVGVSESCQLLASADSSGSVHIHDVDSGSVLFTWRPGHFPPLGAWGADRLYHKPNDIFGLVISDNGLDTLVRYRYGCAVVSLSLVELKARWTDVDFDDVELPDLDEPLPEGLIESLGDDLPDVRDVAEDLLLRLPGSAETAMVRAMGSTQDHEVRARLQRSLRARSHSFAGWLACDSLGYAFLIQAWPHISLSRRHELSKQFNRLPEAVRCRLRACDAAFFP